MISLAPCANSPPPCAGPPHACRPIAECGITTSAGHARGTGFRSCVCRLLAWAGKVIPFPDGEGEPVRLAMPLGGPIGEAWVYPRELSAEEIQRDFAAKKDRFKVLP